MHPSSCSRLAACGRVFAVLAAASLLAACGLNDQANTEERADTKVDAAAEARRNDPDFADFAEVSLPDPERRPEMQVQVVLDRQGFGPGVIDGAIGTPTANALKGFQEANGLAVTGELDEATRQALARWKDVPPTRVVRIPESWGRLRFAAVPEDYADQAKMEAIGYESLGEKLAERFHTTVEVLQALNPGGRPAGAPGVGETAAAEGAGKVPAYPPRTQVTPTQQPGGERAGSEPVFRPGQLVRVPNVAAPDVAPGSNEEDAGWHRTLASLAVGSDQPRAARVVVDESESWLKAYDEAGKLLAMFTVTSGSSHDPLPLGEWGINGVDRNPHFRFDPDLFWDVPDSEDEEMLPPGPNGPVGVVWIDLTKEHYGIHGTPEPQNIGVTQSHGCVRLTNWDAARLAGMVDGSTKVVFQA